MKCSIEECNKRDPKGLYRNASQGKISNLTGIQDPYEPPLEAEVVIDTERQSSNECIEQIMTCLSKLKYI